MTNACGFSDEVMNVYIPIRNVSEKMFRRKRSRLWRDRFLPHTPWHGKRGPVRVLLARLLPRHPLGANAALFTSSRIPLVIVSILTWGFGVAAEEAVALPLRTVATVGNVRRQSANHFLIFCSR